MMQRNIDFGGVMSQREMFDGMDVEAKRFYQRVLHTAMFNLYAVRHRLFDAVLCESSDPHVLVRWLEAEPLIEAAVRSRRQADPGDDCTWNDA